MLANVAVKLNNAILTVRNTNRKALNNYSETHYLLVMMNCYANEDVKNYTKSFEILTVRNRRMNAFNTTQRNIILFV